MLFKCSAGDADRCAGQGTVVPTVTSALGKAVGLVLPRWRGDIVAAMTAVTLRTGWVWRVGEVTSVWRERAIDASAKNTHPLSVTLHSIQA